MTQCHTPGQLQDSLRHILAKTGPQEAGLLQWRTAWTTCGYPEDSTYVDATLQLGLVYLNQSDFQIAVQLSNKVLSLYRRPSPQLRRSDVAKAYYRQGVAFHYLEEEDQKMKVLRKALRAADQSPEG